MKKFCYLAVMLLLTSAVLFFYLKRPDGQPWLTVEGISSHTSEVSKQMASLSQTAITEALNATTEQVKKLSVSLQQDSNITRVYKWQDKQGQWHFSDKPNPNGDSEQVLLDANDVTVIAAEDTTNKIESPKAPVTKKPNVYDPQAVKQLFNDAQNVQQKLDQRNRQLEQGN